MIHDLFCIVLYVSLDLLCTTMNSRKFQSISLEYLNIKKLGEKLALECFGKFDYDGIYKCIHFSQTIFKNII